MSNRFPHGGEVLGATPAHPLLVPALSAAPDLSMGRQQALLDLQAIQRIPGLAGYWSASPEYLFEDSAGTTPATVGGVVGRWNSLSPAVQATTAVKPYLRKTPTSGIYWLDSNTSTAALTATLGNLGASCTVARAGAEGVTFTEGVTISSTYNIAPSFGFNGDVAIFDRALTVTEKALLTRYMQRGVPIIGPELFTNGRFSADTNWTKGANWTISGGTLNHTAGSAATVYQALNKTGSGLLLQASATTVTAGAVGFYRGSGASVNLSVSTGTRTAIVVAGGANIGLYPASDFVGSIDDMSAKEIL